MSFMIYDIILLVVFAIFLALFLYRKKKNLKKEGSLLLYRTSWGMKIIDRIGTKYKKTLKFLSYISIGLGYVLMVGVLGLVYTIVKIYVLRPDVVSAIKVPPIMPLIPYIDKVVDFLPPFYFIYWIIIIAIIAIPHEFAHGIFMRRYNIKIKSTGFGFFPFFLPVFLAAFVEQDEKSMVKAKNFEQRAVLSAGTFANVLTAIFFLIILGIFFTFCFSPAGVTFDDYAYTTINVSAITMINGVQVDNPMMKELTDLVEDSSFNEIKSGKEEFIGIKNFPNEEQVTLYYKTPAMESKLNGAIIEINNVEIKSLEELSYELDKYFPGEEIEIKTKTSNGKNITSIILKENPMNGKSWLGIVFFQSNSGGISGKVFSVISSFKEPHTYYESIMGEFGWFIYYLLWWLVLISVSVALVNMLPMGIFDGGRFFYLTIIALGGSKKFAEKSFKYITYFFLLLLLVIMAYWVLAIFF